MNRYLLSVATLAALLVWSMEARAEDRCATPAPAAPQRIGTYEVALALCGTEAVLTLTDSARQPVDTAGFTAVALGRTQRSELHRVKFQPIGGNRLVGQVDFPIKRLDSPNPGRFRPTVILQGPDGPLGSAQFRLDPIRR